jgi:WbqC-like protein family
MPAPKSIAILQSNYIPWKGYFDIIASVDEFVIFDDVQYTRRDWRNRNKIVLNGSPFWLTIPVNSKGKYHEPIDSIKVADRTWARKHWQTIAQAYRNAPHFAAFAPVLEDLYGQAATLELLTEINELFLRGLSEFLGLAATLTRSDAVPRDTESPTGRLVEICRARAATQYVSGPAAKNYIESELFDRAGIALRYANYSGYPVYEQATQTFEHGVSMVDLIMRCGENARRHLKSIGNRASFLA